MMRISVASRCRPRSSEKPSRTLVSTQLTIVGSFGMGNSVKEMVMPGRSAESLTRGERTVEENLPALSYLLVPSPKAGTVLQCVSE